MRRTFSFANWGGPCRGKSPNMGRCIISYQEALLSVLNNVNHQAREAVLCNHSIKDFGTDWASLYWCTVKCLLIAKL